MKKLLLCSLAIIAMACSNNDDDNNGSTSTNCNCGRVTMCSSFNVVNPVGSPTPVSTFTSFVVLNNCTYRETTYNVNGNQTSAHPVGSQYCR